MKTKINVNNKEQKEKEKKTLKKITNDDFSSRRKNVTNKFLRKKKMIKDNENKKGFLKIVTSGILECIFAIRLYWCLVVVVKVKCTIHIHYNNKNKKEDEYIFI